MATALDIITRSMKSFGAAAAGETLSSDDAADGLAALNSMIGIENTESTSIFCEAINTYALVSGTQTYTIGSGGVFNQARPQKITWANVLDTSQTPNVRIPMKILSYEEWANIRVQSLTAVTVPSSLYCDMAYPLATIYLYGTPGTNYSIELYTWQPLSTFAALTTSVSLPPEYEEFLIYNLALRLMPMFPPITSDVAALVVGLAQNAKAKVQKLNAVTPVMFVDAAVRPNRGVFNFQSGDFNGN